VAQTIEHLLYKHEAPISNPNHTKKRAEITIFNTYVPNVSAPNSIKHILLDLKAHIDPPTMIVGELNFPLSQIDK
jgi:hypothetical protein